MGAHQGRRRLLAGVSRTLTPYEIKRGYVFVSKDRDLEEVLNVARFDVDMDGTVLEARRLDVSGRVHIPSRLLNMVAPLSKVTIRIISASRLEIKAVK